jgi:tetratricopeptide (TPR) repeat protein
LESLQKALELDPNSVFVYAYLAQAYAGLGSYADSLAECETVERLYVGNAYCKSLRSLILAVVGNLDEATSIVSEFKRQPKIDSLSLIYLAEACSVMGKKDEAFAFLEAAYRERSTMLIFLGIKPTFGNIRSDPRFAGLLHRMGLAQLSDTTSY